jgi:hypothetical protein
VKHDHRRQRCYFLLSVKSSGSSVIQRKIAAIRSARLVEHTQHEEMETLFFTKAASILGLPQFRMENSVVPYSPNKARKEMRRLLEANLPGWDQPLVTEADMFGAWTAMVRLHPEDLVEKSPHHLYQPSVISLMERYADSAPDIDCRFVGLVRNPIATLYSSWRRFGVRPEREEKHWNRAYGTLLDFAERRPDIVQVVRYEDLVSGAVDLAEVLGTERDGEPEEKLHAGAVDKWRTDSSFGFRPAPETIVLAKRFGYLPAELSNPHGGPWSLRREPRALAYSLFFSLPAETQSLARSVIKGLAHR